MRASNQRTADHDIESMFLQRWSPRSFTAEPMSEATLRSLFEAARWAPSAFNSQPWRFVYAQRDTPAWQRLFDLLIPYNQGWVARAAVLLFVISDRWRRSAGREPQALYSHSFDAGAAWLSLALQAHALGWAAHGMTGFNVPQAYQQLAIPEADYRVEAAVAIGRPAARELLPEPYQSVEAPSSRRGAETFIFEGRFDANR
jgi:nitroreductase